MKDTAIHSIGTPLFAEERGGIGYRSTMPQLVADKSSVKSAADGGARPVLGLKPKWLADEERLAEVLEAVYRYVRGGLAVPEEWGEELCWLLAAYNDRKSGAARNEMGGQGGVGAALARERQAADVTEHLGADAVRRAMADGLAEEDWRAGCMRRTEESAKPNVPQYEAECT